jgi:streptomycin 6-kinase
LSARDRVDEHIRRWRVDAEQTIETETSFVILGKRGADPVVLKVVKQPGDEWHSGEIIAAFDGHGLVRVYDFVPGAMLLERLLPGHSLVGMALAGGDDEATAILVNVMQRMSAPAAPNGCPTVENWGKGFARYRDSGDERIDGTLIGEAERLFFALSATQRERTLLHGDLQHSNVLYDAQRGWLAIDPKGVIGEREYEVGAVLRNPTERRELFSSTAAVERRVDAFARQLHLDRRRILSWSYAQAVLSAVWCIEDGCGAPATNASLRLAEVIRPLLKSDGHL